MKKTYNINLAGYPFTIDEDAYTLLKDYLDTIRYAFVSKDDTEDIAEDIEGRVAEILIENNYGRDRIVTFEEVTRVVERIGKPSEFIEIEEIGEDISSGETRKERVSEERREKLEEGETRQGQAPFTGAYNPPPVPIKKRLYRDPQNSMLGGVCSGLAHYCGIDVTLVRILTVLLFFLSGTTVAIAYIVLWIVIPEAQTPLQRMQMMGQDTTMENIGRTVTQNFQMNEKEMQPEADNSQQGVFSKIFAVFVKCLIILGLVIAVPLLFAFSIAAIGCIIALFVLGIILIAGVSPGVGFMGNSEELLVFYILLAVIGGVITVGVPLWLFVRKYLRKNRSNPNVTSRRTLLLIWLGGIALLSVFTVKAARLDREIEKEEWLEDFNVGENGEEIRIDEKTGIRVTDSEGTTLIINKDGITVKEKSTTDSLPQESEMVETVSENIETESEVNQNDSVATKTQGALQRHKKR